MNQRTPAGLLAVGLFTILVYVGVTKPLPYATYEPGSTVNVLGNEDQQPIIDVDGHEVYRDSGELRMTTVMVSTPDSELDIFTLMGAWLDGDDAVYPKAFVHPEGQTNEESEIEGQVAMVSSQDAAIAVALKELDFKVTSALEVTSVGEGTPADGELEVRDLLLKINGAKITDSNVLVDAISRTPEGGQVTLLIRRDGKDKTVKLAPEKIDGEQRVGISLGEGFEFPFDVTVNINPAIGGPSAGMMFSLAIYDTLTPGAMTGGESIAGTGTIDADGNVGPIGGIQQKIAGARDDGAELFLVPIDNCQEALGADNDDMRLAVVSSMREAVEAIQSWVADPDATLPGCPKDVADE